MLRLLKQRIEIDLNEITQSVLEKNKQNEAMAKGVLFLTLFNYANQ